MLEKQVQKACLDYLRYRGIFCWKQYNGGWYDKERQTYISSGKKGVSDILGILPDGRFFACEVKRLGGKLSSEQVEFLDEISKRGGAAIHVSSVDELERDLDELIRGARVPASRAA